MKSCDTGVLGVCDELGVFGELLRVKVVMIRSDGMDTGSAQRDLDCAVMLRSDGAGSGSAHNDFASVLMFKSDVNDADSLSVYT